MTITKKFVIVTVPDKTTLFVCDQTNLTFGNKPLAHSFKISRVKVTIYCVAIMPGGMARRLFWLFRVHFSTLVTAH
jgi:hypothetical protein